jgi:hypothetical protein
VEYAISKHLPTTIIDDLRQLNATDLASNQTDYANALAVVNELVGLGNYTDSPVVHNVLKGIVSDGKVSPAESTWTITDVDKDYVVNKDDPNPVNPDTSDLGIGDFNALYVYKVPPTNRTAVQELLNNIPNVSVALLNGYEGGTPSSIQKSLDISKLDPIVKYYSERIAFNWTDPTHGKLIVDGNPVYNRTEPLDLCQSSYYFTHGRNAACDSALPITSLLQLGGYDAKVVEANLPVHHFFTEVTINNKEYVINFNNIIPKSEFYGEWKYVPVATYK